jgi:hypothetical protein
MGLLYIFGAFALFIGLWSVVHSIRLNRLRHERKEKGFTRKHFINEFEQSGISADIPAAVYDFYSDTKQWRDFPFAPGDKYSTVLAIAPDDIEADAHTLVERLQMTFLPEYILCEWGDKPIETLRDMVVWLDWVRRNQPGVRDQRTTKNTVSPLTLTETKL